MWRKPSLYLFLFAILLVFGTFYVPFVAKAAFIWVVGVSGCGLALWTVRQASTLAQRILSVVIAIGFIVFSWLLSEAFQVFG